MRIINRQNLVHNKQAKVCRMALEAPAIAAKARPGQFVVVMAVKEGERIPLTIVDADKDKGTITLIFQAVGFTTELLCKFKEGDSLYALSGPLGHATEIKKYGTVAVVGGGVGIAEVLPVAKAFKAAGNRVISILGARSKELLILEEEMRAVSDELHITTDDGSYDRKGFVTDILKELIAPQTTDPGVDLVYAVGPIPMMQRVAQITLEPKIKTLVSLNALMVDATGMCGCCRVTVGGKVKFSCVDGPEFDAHQVDWEELERRGKIYGEKEKHICKLAGRVGL
ncbi:sulfide/dihydroorotate dehydrogenase-like FAD/NAD-binding protein [Candidatus Omnitrophota bacterium]